MHNVKACNQQDKCNKVFDSNSFLRFVIIDEKRNNNGYY